MLKDTKTGHQPFQMVILFTFLNWHEYFGCLQGTPAQTSTVQIEVIASSSGTARPTFNTIPTGLSIKENIQGNTTVTTVTAQSSNGAAVSYNMAGGNIGDVFDVTSSTGRIYVKGIVDYELMPQYRLWIEAAQGGSTPGTSYAEVVITIEDENDNAPRFSASVYEASIAENSYVGSTLIRVTATDADSGQNGNVTYSLAGKDGSLFRINSLGTIITATKLDRETIAEYSLTVIAMDSVSTVLFLCNIKV